MIRVKRRKKRRRASESGGGAERDQLDAPGAKTESVELGFDHVRVVCRVRPLVATERLHNCQPCVECLEGGVIRLGKDSTFAFDEVLAPISSQHDLYAGCVRPLVDGLFDGFNATVLAYGQTCSGKSFTMGTELAFSADDLVPERAGIVPRVVDDLFTRIAEAAETHEHLVRVSCIEIYNEEVRDLLHPVAPKRSLAPPAPAPPITIRADDQGAVVLAGVKEQTVTCQDELMRLLAVASLAKTTGATKMNQSSNRSHAITTITLERRSLSCRDEPSSGGAGAGADAAGTDAGELEPSADFTIAKIRLVDLAGSERAKRTEATGVRLKESVTINRGLLALGNVISALTASSAAGADATHVPYRDSKLTRVLADSLGGTARTLMIACISPADVNFAETLNTLKYASRARAIRNRPVANRDVAEAQLPQMQSEIERLQLLLLKRAIVHDHDGQPVAVGSLLQGDYTLSDLVRDDHFRRQLESVQALIVNPRASLASPWKMPVQPLPAASAALPPRAHAPSRAASVEPGGGGGGGGGEDDESACSSAVASAEQVPSMRSREHAFEIAVLRDQLNTYQRKNVALLSQLEVADMERERWLAFVAVLQERAQLDSGMRAQLEAIMTDVSNAAAAVMQATLGEPADPVRPGTAPAALGAGAGVGPWTDGPAPGDLSEIDDSVPLLDRLHGQAARLAAEIESRRRSLVQVKMQISQLVAASHSQDERSRAHTAPPPGAWEVRASASDLAHVYARRRVIARAPSPAPSPVHEFAQLASLRAELQGARADLLRDEAAFAEQAATMRALHETLAQLQCENSALREAQAAAAAAAAAAATAAAGAAPAAAAPAASSAPFSTYAREATPEAPSQAPAATHEPTPGPLMTFFARNGGGARPGPVVGVSPALDSVPALSTLAPVPAASGTAFADGDETQLDDDASFVAGGRGGADVVQRLKAQNVKLTRRLAVEAQQARAAEREHMSTTATLQEALEKERHRAAEAEAEARKLRRVVHVKTVELAGAHRRTRGRAPSEAPSESETDASLSLAASPVRPTSAPIVGVPGADERDGRRAELERLSRELAAREHAVREREALVARSAAETEARRAGSSHVARASLAALVAQFDSLEARLASTPEPAEARMLTADRSRVSATLAAVQTQLASQRVLAPADQTELASLHVLLDRVAVAIEAECGGGLDSCDEGSGDAPRDRDVLLQVTQARLGLIDSLDAAQVLLQSFLVRMVAMKQAEARADAQRTELGETVVELEAQVEAARNTIAQALQDYQVRLAQASAEASAEMGDLREELRLKDEKLGLLERDLYYYRTTSRELKERLRALAAASQDECKLRAAAEQRADGAETALANLQEYLRAREGMLVATHERSKLRPLSAAALDQRRNTGALAVAAQDFTTTTTTTTTTKQPPATAPTSPHLSRSLATEAESHLLDSFDIELGSPPASPRMALR